MDPLKKHYWWWNPKGSHPSLFPIAITFLLPIYFPLKVLMSIFILKIQTKSGLKIIIRIFFFNEYSATDERLRPDCPTGQKVMVLNFPEKERPPQKRRLLKDIHLIFIYRILDLEENLKITYLRSFSLQRKKVRSLWDVWTCPELHNWLFEGILKQPCLVLV